MDSLIQALADTVRTVKVEQSPIIQIVSMLVPVLLAVLGILAEWLRRGQVRIVRQNGHIIELVNSTATTLRNDVRALQRQLISKGEVPNIPIDELPAPPLPAEGPAYVPVQKSIADSPTAPPPTGEVSVIVSGPIVEKPENNK